MKIEMGTLLTMNDLSKEELNEKRSRYIADNVIVLGMYFTTFEMQKLKQNFFGRLLGTPSEICIPPEDLTDCRHKFSQNCVVIPKIMNLLVEILIEHGAGVDGIFRINSLPDRVQALLSIIESIKTGSIDFDFGATIIKKSFDVFDIAETYKILFKKYNGPVLSEFFIPLATKIVDVEPREHKVICYTSLLFSLPRQNRMILESCIYLCTYIALKGNGNGQGTKKQMNLMGLGVVMTPNLINFDPENLNFNLVKKLSEFVCWMFDNYQEIVKIN